MDKETYIEKTQDRLIELLRENTRLERENKRLREALNKVQKLGYNEDCLFCGFKDRAVKEALEGGEDDG